MNSCSHNSKKRRAEELNTAEFSGGTESDGNDASDFDVDDSDTSSVDIEITCDYCSETNP
ncbi:hypothetical protein BGZ80_008344, partial [Entomortierella chlamydospora]